MTTPIQSSEPVRVPTAIPGLENICDLRRFRGPLPSAPAPLIRMSSWLPQSPGAPVAPGLLASANTLISMMYPVPTPKGRPPYLCRCSWRMSASSSTVGCGCRFALPPSLHDLLPLRCFHSASLISAGLTTSTASAGPHPAPISARLCSLQASQPRSAYVGLH